MATITTLLNTRGKLEAYGMKLQAEMLWGHPGSSALFERSEYQSVSKQHTLSHTLSTLSHRHGTCKNFLEWCHLFLLTWEVNKNSKNSQTHRSPSLIFGGLFSTLLIILTMDTLFYNIFKNLHYKQDKMSKPAQLPSYPLLTNLSNAVCFTYPVCADISPTDSPALSKGFVGGSETSLRHFHPPICL